MHYWIWGLLFLNQFVICVYQRPHRKLYVLWVFRQTELILEKDDKRRAFCSETAFCGKETTMQLGDCTDTEVIS